MFRRGNLYIRTTSTHSHPSEEVNYPRNCSKNCRLIKLMMSQGAQHSIEGPGQVACMAGGQPAVECLKGGQGKVKDCLPGLAMRFGYVSRHHAVDG